MSHSSGLFRLSAHPLYPGPLAVHIAAVRGPGVCQHAAVRTAVIIDIVPEYSASNPVAVTVKVIPSAVDLLPVADGIAFV